MTLNYFFYLKRASRSSAEKAVVKGLFVTLPRNEMYGFIAYGLHSQQLSCSSGANEEEQPLILPGLFQLPWFCAELSGSSEPIRVSDRGGDRGGPREGKATDLWTGHTSYLPDGKVRAKPQGTAETLAQANSCLKLRFSKYSNCRPRCDDSQQQQKENEEGTFMTLCRVLIDKVLTTEEVVTLEDMRAARASGYDAMYSRSR
jgi:hypothetical protein